jgi:hypothetical protein
MKGEGGRGGKYWLKWIDAPGGFAPAAWASPIWDDAILPERKNETVLIRRRGRPAGGGGGIGVIWEMGWKKVRQDLDAISIGVWLPFCHQGPVEKIINIRLKISN